MNMLALYLFFLHLLPALAATQNQYPYKATDYFLLDCGSISNQTSLDDRNWDGDSNSKFSPHNIQATSTTSTPSDQDPSVNHVPYITARIFQSSKFTYSFPVTNGKKFVRLYFYPATYSGLNKSKSFFSVTANTFTLLSNFSAFLTASTLNPPAAACVKEFIINVKNNQRLTITFIPSPSSYAFINGIEVVSIPNNLYLYNRNDPITFVQTLEPFYFDYSTAFETMYRLNVGGKDVSNKEDTGMFRTWSQDLDYVFAPKSGMVIQRSDVKIRYTEDTPAYTAPEVVYTTARKMGKNPQDNLKYNLTWNFLVDSGFIYLVRLHFCETLLEIVQANQRVFTIFINNQTAEAAADVIQWSGGNGIPVYKEYVVFVPNGSQGKQDLWLALHPNRDTKPQYADAILNGVEIFKLNKSDGSLAGLNPELPPMKPPPVSSQGRPATHSKNNGTRIIAIIGGAVSGAALLSILGFLIFRRRMGVTKSTTTGDSTLPSHLCRSFSLAEIKAATNNFDDVFIIGVGGFGNVYKGYIDDAATPVAIKRLKSGSQQGAHEFMTEIEMLSQLRHLHLVSLIGYCNEDREMILVYDYMAHGTLLDHLYNTDNPPLSWKQRLEICIGAACGLHYLHTGAKHTIIHRDVKTSNILLDEKWVAKVSDFGLSKTGPTGVSKAYVSTVVKGSIGYVDPEYYRLQQLSEKSDVYSFGVVLCEVLCARRPLIRTTEKKQVVLAEWVRQNYHNGTLDQIVDPFLKAKIEPDCLKKFGEMVVNCLVDDGTKRPSMSDVVWGLEFALQLQLESANDDEAEIELYGDDQKPFLPIGQSDNNMFTNSSITVTTTRSGEQSSGNKDSDVLLSQTVFSEFMDAKGR